VDLGLRGKVAIVTGSSRGIGLATARLLAAEGCRTVLCGRGREALDAALAEVRAAGGQAVAVEADVTTVEGVDHLVAEARAAFGPIDVLVNNVGGSRGPHDWQASDADWEAVIGLNVWPAVRVSRAVIPEMVERGRGCIVMVASIYGRESGGAMAYNATKAAEIALAKQLARQLGPRGLRVNAVAPGPILIPGNTWDRRQRADPAGMAAFVAAEIPRGRIGLPEEVASVIAFLCSEPASLVNGVCLSVDGGQSRSGI
jgi:3-oxoacyl-[acyl-carrier protein] reductase